MMMDSSAATSSMSKMPLLSAASNHHHHQTTSGASNGTNTASSISASNNSSSTNGRSNISSDYDHIRNMTLMFFLDRLFTTSKDGKEPRSLHDLSCLFGTKGFTREMRQIVGASRTGLKNFLSAYPSLFTVEGDKVYLTQIKGESNPASRDYTQEAVDYFKNKLVQYGTALVPIKNLFGYRSQATQEVRHVSGQNSKEFKQFLGEHENVFVIHEDHVVLKSVIDEVESSGKSKAAIQKVPEDDVIDPYLTKQFASLVEQCVRLLAFPKKSKTITTIASKTESNTIPRTTATATTATTTTTNNNNESEEEEESTSETEHPVSVDDLHECIKCESDNELFLKMTRTRDDLRVFLRMHPNIFKRCTIADTEYVSLIQEDERREMKLLSHQRHRYQPSSISSSITTHQYHHQQQQQQKLRRTNTNESSNLASLSYQDSSLLYDNNNSIQTNINNNHNNNNNNTYNHINNDNHISRQQSNTLLNDCNSSHCNNSNSNKSIVSSSNGADDDSHSITGHSISNFNSISSSLLPDDDNAEDHGPLTVDCDGVNNASSFNNCKQQTNGRINQACQAVNLATNTTGEPGCVTVVSPTSTGIVSPTPSSILRASAPPFIPASLKSLSASPSSSSLSNNTHPEPSNDLTKTTTTTTMMMTSSQQQNSNTLTRSSSYNVNNDSDSSSTTNGGHHSTTTYGNKSLPYQTIRSTNNGSASLTSQQQPCGKEQRRSIDPRVAVRSYLLQASADNNASMTKSINNSRLGSANQQQQQQRRDLKTRTVSVVRDASQVVDRIMASTDTVAFDCKGFNLGSNGHITLIQLGFLHQPLDKQTTSNSDGISYGLKTTPEVCIFDLVTNPELTQCLKPLLESENIIKVVHDVRNKSSALYRQSEIMLKRVFDTQVANLVIQQQETGKPAYKSRYISASKLCEIYGDATLAKYRNLVKLKSRYTGLSSASSSSGHSKSLRKADVKYWCIRPLTESMIYESTVDVYCLIGGVYQNLRDKIKPEYLPLFTQLNEEGVMAMIAPDEIKNLKKERKIDLEVIDLKRKLYSETSSSIVLSNREIRLLRHVELTDEVRSRIQQCRKVAKKLERLDQKAAAMASANSESFQNGGESNTLDNDYNGSSSVSQMSGDYQLSSNNNLNSFNRNQNNLINNNDSSDSISQNTNNVNSHMPNDNDDSNNDHDGDDDYDEENGMTCLIDSSMFDMLKDTIIESTDNILDSMDAASDSQSCCHCSCHQIAKEQGAIKDVGIQCDLIS